MTDAATAPAAPDNAKPAHDFRLWTVPNMLTLSRFVIAPVTLTMLVLGAPPDASVAFLWAAISLMIVSEITDNLDGRVARATGQVSDTGKLLDPLSDVTTHNFIFLAFVAAGWLPVWMMAIMLFREFLVAYLRIFCALHGVVLQARWSGKVKSFVIAIAQFGTIIAFALPRVGVGGVPSVTIAFWLLLIATCVTAYSGVDYLRSVIRGFSKGGTGTGTAA
ncbi:MAG: CDP-alcohol phosphatidyltransferase family protein [Planctomycetota bacterium]